MCSTQLFTVFNLNISIKYARMQGICLPLINSSTSKVHPTCLLTNIGSVCTGAPGFILKIYKKYCPQIYSCPSHSLNSIHGIFEKND